MRKKSALGLAALIGSVGAALAGPALLQYRTLAMLLEGYSFTPKWRERYGSDIFGPVAFALHEHPECREKLRDDEYLELFVQEVRRFYPFFPFIGGRARYAFDWDVHHFDRGAWMIHGPVWDQPRRADMGGPGGVPAGTVPPVGRERLRLHPPGRR